MRELCHRYSASLSGSAAGDDDLLGYGAFTAKSVSDKGSKGQVQRESVDQSRCDRGRWPLLFHAAEPVVALVGVRAGTPANSGPRPSAMVGCVNTASRSAV
jgi:hypothetical protein